MIHSSSRASRFDHLRCESVLERCLTAAGSGLPPVHDSHAVRVQTELFGSCQRSSQCFQVEGYSKLMHALLLHMESSSSLRNDHVTFALEAHLSTFVQLIPWVFQSSLPFAVGTNNETRLTKAITLSPVGNGL